MSDYLKSDNCEDCGGEGFRYYITHQTEEYVEHETDQCAECEELHKQEVRADRLHDEMKGN